MMLCSKTFKIAGMHCTTCVSNLETVFQKHTGVQQVSVSLVPPQMLINYDDTLLDVEAIQQLVAAAGYQATLKDVAISQQATAKSTETELTTLGELLCSVAFLGFLMYFSMGSMFQWPLPANISESAIILTELLLALPIVYLNRRYYQRGYKALWKCAANMDSLVAISSSAALLYGVVILYHSIQAMANDSGIGYLHDVYLETGAMILVMVSIGKYLEGKSQHAATAALEQLMNLAPKSATVLRENTEVEIPVAALLVGDLVIVKPSQSIPVDGIVTEGEALVDESSVTGESKLITKSVGKMVISGTVNKQGSFTFRATKVGKDTVLAQIINLVETAAASKAPIARLADRVSAIFVPGVLSISLVSLLVWLLCGADFEFAFARAIAVLVISCPCALGLATPIAILVGSSKGATLGILVKDAAAFEAMARIDTVVFDKTGTLTVGKPMITDMQPVDGVTETSLLQLSASLENRSVHPIAKTIVDYALQHEVQLLPVEEFMNVDGAGVQGRISGKTYFIGSESALRERMVDLTSLATLTQQLQQAGKTIVYMAEEQRLLGLLALTDVLQENAATVVAELHTMSIKTLMLTGDSQAAAARIQQQLALDAVKAELTPDQKVQIIDELQAEGKQVAMVGDGINDAPALVKAEVGMAMGNGTDIAMETANVVLMRTDLSNVVTALQLSKAVLKNIRENFIWAFGYNLIGIPLAAGLFYPWGGWQLSPMFGAMAMSLSSILVVLNALRLKAFKRIQLASTAKTATSMQAQVWHKRLNLTGLNCQHCADRVAAALNAIPDVTATVDLAAAQAEVTATVAVENQQLIDVVVQAGYGVAEIQEL